jgi:hypothetical protein
MTLCGQSRNARGLFRHQAFLCGSLFRCQDRGSSLARSAGTYGIRLGEAGFNAYHIAKLMGHPNISTSQRYVRNLPVGSGEAVMLKNQRGHNTVTSEASGTLALVVSR